MPYRPSWRASRISRAAWASVRTGTGPSLAAIPPNSSRVISAVLAPRSAARSAASTPAGPAPITMTSNIYGASLLCLKVGEPAQGSQSGHEAIFTAPSDDKLRDALKAFANRAPWNCKVAALVVRPGYGILIVARPEKDAVIYPLRLDELELTTKVRSDKREHQSPIGAVVLQDSFREQRAIGSSAPNHSVQPDYAGHGG